MAAKKTAKKKPAKKGKAKAKPKAKPKSRARAKPSLSSANRGVEPSIGSVAVWLQKVLKDCEGAEFAFTPEENSKIAAYYMAMGECTIGQASVFLRIKHDSDKTRREHEFKTQELALKTREMELREELARKGIYPIAHVIIDPPKPPEGATDPPEVT